MRTRRPGEPRHTSLLALVAGALTLLLAAAGGNETPSAAPAALAVSWQGLVGARQRPHVALGQRMLVVMNTPSLADRVAAAGGRATDRQERAWTGASLSQQRLLIQRMAVQGAIVRPEFSFARVLSGFSALLDARAVSLLLRDQAVQGVYPVRVAYPASVSSSLLDSRAFTRSLASLPGLALPGFDGRGVTIALLDTGVDRTHPFVRGAVTEGIDIVDPQGDATPRAKPGSSTELERHGTQLAGLVVGDNGPSALRGVAPGATILPIRVAGWQPDARGGYGIYARTDQLIAGIERAVDPNADGDAHDAARVALVGVAAPYAGFADDPGARAVAGAVRLDMLVVAPAGNDGAAGPAFGSISGPGGAAGALTVGAADTRTDAEEVRVSLRTGLRVVLDRSLPLVGAVAPHRPLTAAVAAPALERPQASFSRLAAYFTKAGFSTVAGRIALVPASGSPATVARSAARAGAIAVLLYGAPMPSGGIGLDEDVSVPVIGVPAAAAARLLNGLVHGADAAASIGRVSDASNDANGTVASFSSLGLAYDGRVKPDLVAPGVGLATADPGTAPDGTPRYATVNGSSASAALVAGAAAVLAQARPALVADALHSLLVGTARSMAGETNVTQGAGYVSLGAAAAGELATDPATLALGDALNAGWHVTRLITVHNVSARSAVVRIRVRRDSEGAAAVRFSTAPSLFVVAPGAAQQVRISVRIGSAPVGRASATGSLVIGSRRGASTRVPWAVTFGPRANTLLGPLHLSTDTFAPSDAAPALLTFQAGRIVGAGGRPAVQAVSLLELRLFRRDGTDLGTLARLRDLLPGRYAFGLTGRSPAGNALGHGEYFLRVSAWPTLPGPASRKQVAFTIAAG